MVRLLGQCVLRNQNKLMEMIRIQPGYGAKGFIIMGGVANARGVASSLASNIKSWLTLLGMASLSLAMTTSFFTSTANRSAAVAAAAAAAF